ncbi:MAG: hypothetical protein HOV78_13905 [Hamadaea sp.]|nr:hypothetical protein [Hamadaea sp.]NUT03117.1 hypothetical protein [Hamadaea sp.]
MGGDDVVVRRWRRVNPAGPAQWLILGFGAIILAFAAAFARSAVQQEFRVAEAAFVGGFLTLMLVYVWRMYRTGIYVRARQVRIVRVLRTRTLPWADVADVYSRPARISGLATVREAIVVRLVDGTEVETPVQRQADRVVGPRKTVGPVLTDEQFADTVAFLQATRLYEAGPQE